MGSPKEETKKLCRQVKHSVCLDCRQMWEETAKLLEKATRLHDTCKLYQILKESVGKKAPVSEIVKNRSGKIISCQKEHSARWKDHFQFLQNPSPSSAHDAFPTSIPKEPNDIELDTPTRVEILKVIKTLKIHKAPGEDGLPWNYTNNALRSLLNSSMAFSKKSGGPTLSQKIGRHQSSSLYMKRETKLNAKLPQNKSHRHCSQNIWDHTLEPLQRGKGRKNSRKSSWLSTR